MAFPNNEIEIFIRTVRLSRKLAKKSGRDTVRGWHKDVKVLPGTAATTMISRIRLNLFWRDMDALWTELGFETDNASEILEAVAWLPASLTDKPELRRDIGFMFSDLVCEFEDTIALIREITKYDYRCFEARMKQRDERKVGADARRS